MACLKIRIDDDVLGFACVYGPWEVLEQRVPPLAALAVVFLLPPFSPLAVELEPPVISFLVSIRSVW